ncbi:MAG: hypothetical protein QW258_01780 [Thermoplasmata archaeon]
MAETKTCSVSGCNEESYKTVGKDKAMKIFNLKEGEKRAHLCKEHYKEYKKKTKKEREIDRVGWV